MVSVRKRAANFWTELQNQSDLPTMVDIIIIMIAL